MIVAVDPGKMTGIAVCSVDGTQLAVYEYDTWQAVSYIETWMPAIDALVCENYIITMQTLKKTRGENWSLESIGALRYLCHRDEVPFVLQTPADAKKFSTDSKLKRAGWWNPTTGGHANDAARHLLLYFARTNRLDLVL